MIVSNVDDEDDDGAISFDEYFPLRVLVEQSKGRVKKVNSKRPLSGAFQMWTVLGSLPRIMIGEFASVMARENNQPETGQRSKVTVKQLRRVIQKLSNELLQLSQVQIAAIAVMAQAGEDGLVDVPEFVADVAPIIQKLVKLSRQKIRAEAIDTMAWADGVAELYGLDDGEIREVLTPSFLAACEPFDEFRQYHYLHLHHAFISVIEPLGMSKIELAGTKRDQLMAGIDSNADGVVEMEELVSFVSDVVKQVSHGVQLQSLWTTPTAAVS